MLNKRIKVFFFIDSFRIGGMHRQILYLVRHLNKEVFEPIVCTTSPDGGLRGEFEKVGCKLFDLKWKRKLDPLTFVRLVKLLNKEKPDIVFITEAQNLFYYRIARIFCKQKAIQIGSFRAMTFWNGHLNKHYQLIDNFFSRWLYASSVSVVVNSLALSDHYSKILKINPKKPIKIIYNGSDFNFPITRTTDEIRQELKITSNEIVIIMVARLDPWKDFSTLLETAEIVIKSDSRAKFLLAGDGELRKIIEQKIFQKGLIESVLIVGEKKDIYNYINAADISVLSTNGEGFSNSILESMALCKPVIATNVGGNSEVIGVTNETGILVPTKSPELFADAILHLMKNEIIRNNIGNASKIRINQLCGIEKLISSYEKLFLKSIQ
jgi:glycosyltransferase involved in cell wall biosynthesis